MNRPTTFLEWQQRRNDEQLVVLVLRSCGPTTHWDLARSLMSLQMTAPEACAAILRAVESGAVTRDDRHRFAIAPMRETFSTLPPRKPWWRRTWNRIRGRRESYILATLITSLLTAAPASPLGA